MSWTSLLAIYFVIWWLVFFVTLPFGVRTQQEDEEGVILGTVPSAPVKPMLLRKALATTLISALLGLGFWLLYERLGWDIEALSRLGR
jgi:predicted secreted protein